MTGRTHVLSGALAVAAVAPIAGPPLGIHWSMTGLLAATLVGGAAGLLPDIDHPDGSIAHGKIPYIGKMLGRFGFVITFLVSLPLRLLGMLLRVTMGHRGPTHTLIGLVFFTVLALPLYVAFGMVLLYLAALVLALVGVPVEPLAIWSQLSGSIWDIWPAAMLVVFLAVASHLIVDMFNTVPLRIFWPASRRAFFLLPKGLRIRVESPAEWVFARLVMLALLVAIGLILLQGYEQFATTDSVRQALLGPLGGA
jgi:membrane-bound metal-dependent hydrolase YbcI (DUF457 family)